MKTVKKAKLRTSVLVFLCILANWYVIALVLSQFFDLNKNVFLFLGTAGSLLALWFFFKLRFTRN
jgi:hypothetical protein